MRIPSEQYLMECGPQAFASEGGLQRFIEDHLVASACGLRVVSSSRVGGRRLGCADTLAIDDEGTPVIIEYKRDRVGRGAMNQVARYKKWLLTHREKFEQAVLDRYGGLAINWRQIHLVTVGHRYHRSLASSSLDDSTVWMLRYGFHPDKSVFIREVDRKDLETFGNQQPPIPVKDVKRYLVKTTVAAQEAFELLRNRLTELQFVEKVPGKNRVRYWKKGDLLAQVTFTEGGGLRVVFEGGGDIPDPESRASHPTKGSWKWTIGIDSLADVEYVIRLLPR